MKKWKIGGGVVLAVGLILLILAAGRADGDLGSIFRQGLTGLFLCALGAAALYADQAGENNNRKEDDDVLRKD